jgi:hypothetical protein
MRIIIEIEGDQVDVKTDRQAKIAFGDTNMLDAGPPHAELLAQFGKVDQGKNDDVEAKLERPEQRELASMNPLRRGEAIAHLRTGRSSVAGELADAVDNVDAGEPKIAKTKGRKASASKKQAKPRTKSKGASQSE